MAGSRPVASAGGPAGGRTGVAGDRGAAAPSGRVQWADTAKGACILLVVLWHVVMKHYLRLNLAPGPFAGAWGTLGEQLLPMRMPLFFTISGIFAVNAIHRPWRTGLRSRVAKFGYLYALWLVVHTLIFSRTPGFPTAHAGSLGELVEQLTITPSNQWYLFALAVYFVIAKATRNLPRAVVLAPALALSILASAQLVATPGDRGGLYQNLVFFLCGVYFRPAIERLAQSANWPRLALVTGAYGAMPVAVAVLGAGHVPGVWPVVCVGATVFGVVLFSMVSRWRPLAAPLTGIGTRTLPIYVMHMPVLALLDLALHGPLSRGDGLWAAAIAVGDPLVLTLVVAGVCLLLHRALELARVSGVLFDLPGGVTPRHAASAGATGASGPAGDHSGARPPGPAPAGASTRPRVPAGTAGWVPADAAGWVPSGHAAGVADQPAYDVRP